MLLEDQHPHNRAIMAAVLGVPNAGKSSLINHLIGTDLSVVTTKPQTTRNFFHCVVTIDRTEIVFVDTPGLHKSNQEFNKRLNEAAREGSRGADLNLVLIDISREVIGQFQELQSTFNENLGPAWLVFTKADKVENADKLPLAEVYEKAREYFPSLEKYFLISSVSGFNIHQLTGALCDSAQPGPHHYPNGDLSNKNQRFFVAEYIREQTFLLLKDELPYEIAILIDEYKEIPWEKDPTVSESFISASILVNRPSQRAIVVGASGAMIKEIGIRARKKIEVMTGGPAHLNLHVKVSPKWFSNNFVLEEIGLPRAADSNRVWHQR